MISSLVSQTIFAAPNPVTPVNKLTALTHAELIISPDKRLSNATLLIENNRIKAVIEQGEIPQQLYKLI